MATNASVRAIVGSAVFELCVFNKYKKPDWVGYFDDTNKADQYIAINQTRDVYLTPQILNPSLTQRAHNQMVRANERTTDTAVIGYRYLLIDLDPLQKLPDGRIVKRPPGVSATDEEHQAALSLARHIVSGIGLKDENYILTDSGNGAHVYISVDTGIQRPAIEAATNGIKILYETETVEVDSTVSNPARLMRAPGSMNCKGGITRPCTYLHCPEHIIPVSYDFIAGLKVETVQEPRQKDGADLAEKIANELGFITKKPGPLWVLKSCPFCKSTDKGAVVGRVGADGGYFFKCQHNRCKNKKWPDLKAHVGLATSMVDRVKKTLKEQGKVALDLPEVQAEINKLKASGDLGALKEAAEDVGIAYKTLKAAARRPFAIAQDLSDGWILEYHLLTDRLTRRIYHYDGGVYIEAEDFIAGLIDEKFRGINTKSFINNVLDYIRRHSLYDFKDECIAVENGIIDPVTLDIMGFSPENVTRIKLNVAYDKDARCPSWLKFLDECKSEPGLLQETAGYPLLTGYPWQKAVMLLGGGGQGKSVFLKVLSEILNTENVSAASLQTLVDNRFGTNSLYGKLANMAGDLPDLALSNTAIFKGLTGDDRIHAEEKGTPAYDFLNRAKLLFSANALPPSKDKSTGYMRRWILIDFNREMVQNPNPRLAAELLAEKAGILNWMLEGAKRLNDNGFSYTQDPEEMAKLYIERSEPVTMFLKDCCEEDFDGFETSKKLYATYNAWARVKHKKRMGSREFLGAMKNQTLYSTEHRKEQRQGECFMLWGFDGLRLVKDSDQLAKDLLKRSGQ